MADIDILVKSGIFGVGGAALGGVVGQCFVPTAYAVAAGTMGGVAASCAAGTAILFLPYLLLKVGLNELISKENNPFTHGLLSMTLDVGLAVSSAVLGATILGLAATPIACCALAGVAAFTLGRVFFDALVVILGACFLGAAAVCGITNTSSYSPRMV